MHHHLGFDVGIFAFFVLGAGMNVWRHAASVVNSKLNGIDSYQQYFVLNGALQAFKTFGAFCFLIFWLYHQSAVENLVATVWPSFLGSVPAWAQGILVVTPATAGAFGLFFDVLLDLVLVYVKKKFPQIVPAEVPPTKEPTHKSHLKIVHGKGIVVPTHDESPEGATHRARPPKTP